MSAPTPEETSWPELHRERRALVVVDVVESVRLMQAHEADVIDRWRRFVNEVRTQVLPAHGGRLVKSLGDGMLLEFENVPSAVAAAQDLQRRAAALNVERDSDRAMHLRVGVHACEVVVDQLDLYGAGVNLVARLATLAGPGEIVVSEDVAAAAVPGLDPDLEDLGLCYVKHLTQPIRAFRLLHHTEPQRRGVGLGDRVPTLPQADLIESRTTLAVLPFVTRGGARRALALGDVLADSLVARLCASSHVRVISRLSTALLRGRELGLVDTGALLGARYLLSGHIELIDARFVLSVELADAVNCEVLWTDRALGQPADLLEPDDPHSQRLAGGVLEAVMEAEVRRVRTVPLPTLEGFAMQTGASVLMHRATLPEFRRARELLDELVERHPRAPSARAWLAQWHVLRATRGLIDNPAAEANHALQQTRRALDLDPENSFALTMEAFAQCHLLGDLEAAELRLDQALEVNPNEALAWLVRCVVQGFRNEGDAAWASAQRAISLSPLDPQRHYFDSLAASAAVAARRLDDAVLLARRSLQGNRNHLPTLRALTVALAESGDLDAARAAAQRVIELDPDFTVRNYVSRGPRGAEATRQRYAEALLHAGLPH